MADTGNHTTDYGLSASQAIINFQFLEEAIKMYLEAAYWIVQQKVDEFPVKLSRKDIENWSSGRLREFQKLPGSITSSNHEISVLMKPSCYDFLKSLTCHLRKNVLAK
jgi:hypothetical protein